MMRGAELHNPLLLRLICVCHTEPEEVCSSDANVKNIYLYV